MVFSVSKVRGVMATGNTNFEQEVCLLTLNQMRLEVVLVYELNN